MKRRLFNPLRGIKSDMKLHPEYGINATKTVCYICGNVLFYTPFFDTINKNCNEITKTIPNIICPKCKERLEHNTLFIETIEDNKGIEFGAYLYIKDDALEQYFENVNELNKINYMCSKDFQLLRDDILSNL